ncbi:contactin-associated protein-like 5 [Clavelina lepadiformis]
MNGTKTIVEHDSMAEIEASKCRGARCYKRVIRYNVDLKQIAALIQVSQSCRQFIKYRCGGSVLLYGSATDYGSWVSRNGTRMKYWGGAASRRDNYCACGETGTCVESDQLCNCDKNNLPETSDEGYITDPDALPVTQLQFGDTDGSGEYGFHTLGALECTGRRRE